MVADAHNHESSVTFHAAHPGPLKAEGSGDVLLFILIFLAMPLAVGLGIGYWKGGRDGRKDVIAEVRDAAGLNPGECIEFSLGRKICP